jgi:hypothetical protein
MPKPQAAELAHRLPQTDDPFDHRPDHVVEAAAEG